MNDPYEKAWESIGKALSAQSKMVLWIAERTLSAKDFKEFVDEFAKDQKYKDECPDGRCKDCEDARVVTAYGQWQFLGCHHNPYKGKWVAEIKDCPKGEPA